MKLLSSLALLAACGSSTPPMPDAPAAVVDSQPAGAGPITVNAPYLDASTRVTPGAPALFYDAGGALIDRVVTGADGRATGTALPESMVLVIPPAAGGGDYFSWYGVSPGDALSTQSASAAPAAPADGRHVVITAPRYSTYAAKYVLGGVGLAATTTVAPGTDAVTFDTTLDPGAPQVGDVVSQTSDGVYTYFLTAHDVAMDTGLIDLGSVPWRIADNYNATLHLPADAHWVVGYYKRLAQGRVVWESAARADEVPAGDFSLSFAVPSTAGDGSALVASYTLEDGTAYALSYNAPDPGIMLSQLLPVAKDVVLGGDNAVTWTSPGGASVGVVITLSALTEHWHIVMPAGAQEFHVPPIPSDLRAPSMMSNVRVSYAGGNDAGGYRALRTTPDAFDLLEWAQALPSTPGTYRVASD